MTLIKIEGRIVNIDLVTSVVLDEPTQTLILHMTQGQFAFPLNDTTQAAYDWLSARCIASFEVNHNETASHGLSADAWRLMKRIEHHERRTDLPGLPIDDDDTEATIELERGGYVRSDVHNAWLTEAGRTLLEEHRAENADADED